MPDAKMHGMAKNATHNAEDWPRFDSALCEAATAIGLALESSVRLRMYAHYQRMVDANRQFNLTRILSPAEAAVKHYADSLTLLATSWVNRVQPMFVLDVGTGAGLPAVPLAMTCKAWRMTAIDGTGKKARFVAETVADLGLSNVRAIHVRAGAFSCKNDELFDLVLLRAVTKIGTGLAEVRSLVKPGGAVVFYKTPGIDAQELSEGIKVGRRSGFAEGGVEDFTLPLGADSIHRRLLRYELRVPSH